MSIVLHLGQGQRARLESTDGHFVTLVSTQPFPPGATLRGELDGEPAPYLVKVRGSRRAAPPESDEDTSAAAEFIVEGRWVNLTRRQRDRVGV